MSITEGVRTAPARTRLAVDPHQSAVEFSVRTFWGLLTVHGRFDRFEGAYELGPGGTTIDLAIDAVSIDTGNATRDGHLRADDFFQTAEHPEIRFTSTSVRNAADGLLHVEGLLTAAGNVVPLDFFATVRRAGAGLELEATTTVDQRELGMSSGKLGMIRPPATLHVRARVEEAAS
ncbi:MAG: YceI family protein [Actinobacteria bacterium]|nr:YceI family protein [Actinomycetota bacterium]